MDIGCTFPGNLDLYGKGIRAGLYLQMFAAIIAGDICPKEIPGTRLAIQFFTTASFVALTMQTNRHEGLDNIGETLSGVFILL